MADETTTIFTPAVNPELPEDRFLERELSWLDFNQRVLELAEDPTTPLLERINYLSIFASNLDEFFMVRVASLKRRIATGIAVTSPSGLSPQQVLQKISERTRVLQQRHSALFINELLPKLAEADINLVHISSLTEDEKKKLHDYFTMQVFP
jgi:polyphosphate kinase